MATELKKPVGSLNESDVKTARLAQEFVNAAAPAQSQDHLKGTAMKAYNQHTKKAAADKLVVDFLPLVHKIVHQIASYLHPPLTREDLVSAGTIGLIKAARDFDSTKEAEFKTYAYIRVRGAVLDELRSWSFTPSSIKKQFEQAQQLVRDYVETNGVEPTDEQLAKMLGITTDKMYRMFETARARHFLSIHGINEEAPALGRSLMCKSTENPGSRIEKQELSAKLAEAIGQLPEKQKQIILLYYHKELTMKEAAMVLGVTESRVSQLHAAALFKLSTKLKLWDKSKT
ncbi:MAG: RNA polymerase sigma factor FliA [Planctomycetes bacterium]|nr:RNA polymerase sigma factor FliA [Planctomycetota bacterium]